MEIIDGIFQLYIKHGDEQYIGEKVSQLEHALQCAYFAENENFPKNVILGAFFHDIGHLMNFGNNQQDLMEIENVNYGPKNHEKLGANFLRNLKVPESICEIVEKHVLAKRYLVFKDTDYYNKLSFASKQTLKFQGGSMNQFESDEFEKNPIFNVILKMRTWDDLAKDTNLNLSANGEDIIGRYKSWLSDFLVS